MTIDDSTAADSSPRHSSCPACGAPAAREFEVAESMFGWPETHSMAECQICASLWLTNPPEDLSPYYPSDYYSLQADPETLFGGKRRRPTQALSTLALFGPVRLAQPLLRSLKNPQADAVFSILASVRRAGLRAGRRTRIVDVGCGSGHLAYILGLAGLKDVTGVDPFLDRPRSLSSGASLRRGNLSDLSGSFDLIMFHHSFEHVDDPQSVLSEAAGRLGPDGRILIRTPTPSSDAYDQYGADWFQLDAPRHTFIPSRDGMRRLAAGSGLEIVSEVDDSSAIQFWRSEQVKAGLPMQEPTSSRTPDGQPMFTAEQLADWAATSRRLNAAHRGDQSSWVLKSATNVSS